MFLLILFSISQCTVEGQGAQIHYSSPGDFFNEFAATLDDGEGYNEPSARATQPIITNETRVTVFSQSERLDRFFNIYEII